MGAPAKIDAEMRRRIVQCVRKGLTFTETADTVGVTRYAIHKARLADKDFDAAIREAIRINVGQIEDALFKAAKGGNVTAQIFYLVNKTRHLPPEERYENTNRVDITAKTRPDELESMTDAQLEAIARGEGCLLPGPAEEVADPYADLDDSAAETPPAEKAGAE